MPQFLSSVGSVVENASQHFHSGEGKRFLDAFLGNQLERSDETGTFRLNPLTGSVELESPGGFKLSASPVEGRIQGDFRFGGPNTSIVGRDPKQALDEALGTSPNLYYGPEPMSAGRQEMEKEIGNYLERNPYGYR